MPISCELPRANSILELNPAGLPRLPVAFFVILIALHFLADLVDGKLTLSKSKSGPCARPCGPLFRDPLMMGCISKVDVKDTNNRGWLLLKSMIFNGRWCHQEWLLQSNRRQTPPHQEQHVASKDVWLCGAGIQSSIPWLGDDNLTP